MHVDHNYAAFSGGGEVHPPNELSLTPILSAVLTSNFEKSNYETPVSHSICEQSEESNGLCHHCHVPVSSPEELKKHEYCYNAFKIYSCGKCGCICKNERCLDEHLQIHDKEAQNCPNINEGGKQIVTRVIPVVFIVKEHNSFNGNQDTQSVSTNDDLATDVVQQSKTWTPSSTPTEIPLNDHEKAFTEVPLRVKEHLNPTHQKQHCKLTTNIPVKRFPCLKCGKAFSTRHSLRRHNIIHIKDYVCEKCEDRPTFRTFSEHVKHARTAHWTAKEKPKAETKEKVLCEVCGKQFKSTDVLRNHRALHNFVTPKDYAYNQCGKTCSNGFNLSTHKAIHSSERPFICDICGRNFKWNRCLIVHLKRHYNQRNLNCQVCGRSFDTRSNLTRHIMIHTGEKPFMCEVCGKSFRQKVILQDHMMCHSDVRKYACRTCGKRFKNRSTHRKHELLHNDNVANDQTTYRKRYKCDHCEKHFPDKTQLRLHQTAHSDERNYSCDECGKAFKTSNALQVHKKIHLAKISSIRYYCKMCNKRFRAVKYVKTHIKYFHPEALLLNTKVEGLYEVVSNEHCNPSKEASSKCNLVFEQESAVQALQDLCMGIPQTMEDMQQACEYYLV